MLSEYRAGHRVTRTRRVFGELDPRFARRLGRVVALQALLPDDRMSALTLFKALIDAQGVRALDPQHGKLALDLAFHLRDWAFLERYRRELPAHESARRFVELDLHNPFTGSPFANHDRWLELLNQHYLEAGIAPLELEAVDSAAAPVPFDRLSTGSVAAVEGGDLVTVVMSSWQPDDSLVYAMRSVTKQTWRNLEILLIDDASPDEFTPLLESVAASDPRIRLIRQPFNAGTYVARNRGMKEAKGRYFTVHDSDDWAHPQRIERQVAALQRDSRLVSSGSFAFRCDDNLVVNLPGVLPDRENASSLTFELEKVRARIGYFDESRKGADTEYVLRMRAAFGEDSHHVLGEPLAMIRLRPDSLSRAEFKPGWRHPARAMYRRGYEAWHRRIRHDPAGAYLPSPLRQRPFNLPARFQVERAASRFGDRGQGYDIVFAADFRASAGLDRSICHEIRLARRAGLKTGLLHMESFWHASLREIEPFDPDVEQWLHDKLVDEVLYTDEYRIGLLVIRDPSVLQFPQPRASTLGVESMLVVAGAVGKGQDGCAPFDPGDCANKAFAMFGIEPRWCARGEGGAAALVANLSSRHVVPQRWPESVLEFADIPRAGLDPASRAIIGAIVSSGNVDPVVEWWSALGEATVPAFLRVLGPHGSSGITAPASVTVEPGWTPRLAFLAGCDFYTDFPVTVPDASRHRWIVEAMAQGCIPVVSGQWRQIFGDAVEYCLPDDLPARVLELARDPERLAQARARAHAWVRAHHDPQPLHAFWSLAGAKQDADNIEEGAHAAADDASPPLAHASGSA